jgi:hypothetical protein
MLAHGFGTELLAELAGAEHATQIVFSSFHHSDSRLACPSQMRCVVAR